MSTQVMIAHEVPLVRAGLEVALQGKHDVAMLSASELLGRMSASAGRAQRGTVRIVVADCATGPQLAITGRSSGYRVLIVTSDDTETSVVRAVEAGVRGYLLLTSSLEGVVGAVRSLTFGGTALDPIVATRMIDSLTFNSLTNREEEVLRLVMVGLGDKAIANRLGRSVGTVKTHVKALLFKLKARCRTEAVAIAQRRGFVSAEPAQPPSRYMPVAIASASRGNLGRKPRSSRIRRPSMSVSKARALSASEPSGGGMPTAANSVARSGASSSTTL